MRAYLLFLLVLSRLFWWDLLDKIRITVSWNWARRGIDREMSHRARGLFAVARLAVGLHLRIDVDDRRMPSRILIIANHQSVIDIVAIMAAFRHHAVRFVAKRELRHWFPAVSRVLRVQRHALISRSGDFASAMKQIERLGRTIRDNEGAVIFPEGTRSRDGAVHTFHSGAVRRILASQPLPIVAVAVDGGIGISRMQDLVKMKRGHQFRIAVVAEFPPVTGKRELIEQLTVAETVIAETLAEWRERGYT
ncbi:MAG: lysophospholipid acyltransferase family protein [Alkalispirochaeta sp.]